MTDPNPDDFKLRLHSEDQRMDDVRNEYERDKARVLHSAGFRRLQGKTQVMGVGEGDFHRTRLTHSIEVAQIGRGILLTLRRHHQGEPEIAPWLPDEALIETACYAHDLGHPPFGHGGERALQECMFGHGGFEGNAQTLRILAKLEKYRKYQGINPTRRTLLSVLKYPVCYDEYDENRYQHHPPKCYYATERNLIDWVLEPLSADDRRRLVACNQMDKPRYRSLDASLMEYADDIAYAVHDLEDIVARNLISRSDLAEKLNDIIPQAHVGSNEKGVSRDDFLKNLFDDGSHRRKQFIGRLVNLFVTETKIQFNNGFDHPLLRLRVGFCDSGVKHLLARLKSATYDLVIKRAPVQQLERRGKRVVEALHDEFLADPEVLIPTPAWESFDPSDTKERRVCDYIAGMTDSFAGRIYNRLFTPGFGSSRDEL